MSARLINGTQIAKDIAEELKQEVAELKRSYDLIPGLATVLVGEDPGSQLYVASKVKMCHSLGMYSEHYDLPADSPEEKVLQLVDRLNRNGRIHGILVQLPLPKHINESAVLLAINPQKDVDGLHPTNIGKMVIGEPDYLPCTPHGIQVLLARSGIETDGANVVVVGRSNMVGKPIANILFQKKMGANATVTLCHTHTRDLAEHTRRADILIIAAGQPRAITADMVKEGAVVIDVGTHRIGRTAEGKNLLCGDVDFEAVKEKTSAITPVPGGVGPMTIVMLMLNTVRAARLAYGLGKPAEVRYGIQV